MQALILVGGEGTRLRPLTAEVPKPVVTLVDRPFLAYMLEWLAGHGVDDVVLSCGFKADKVRAVLGDGSAYGVRLTYREEPSPLGTGGALKFCEDLLDERFLMLNGDVLTDIDLGAQLAQHEQTGATGTLALVPVSDPSNYGLVRTAGDASVLEFLEKPEGAQPRKLGSWDNTISAGAYVLERSVLDLLEPGVKASIEREVFPRLVGNGLYARVSDRYWLDIGTPDRYLQGTFDILSGTVATRVVADSGVVVGTNCVNEGRVEGPAVLGSDVRVGPGAVIERAVVLDGAVVGSDAVVRECVVCPGAVVGDGVVVEPGTIVG
ncbi:MAG: NDP-sugar synthase [Solirubrobacteraceae bacterium]